MSTNIQASGPGGVLKRFGPLGLGGEAGAIRSNDSEVSCVFEIKAGEGAASNTNSITIPVYSRVIKCYMVVSEVYATSSTIDVQLGGNSILSGGTALDLTALGNTDNALHATAANILTAGSTEALKVVLNANALASTTGKGKIVVVYVRA